MRPLIIDENARAEIAKVLEFAELNRIYEDEMRARVAVPKGYSPPGDDSHHVCHIDVGFRCVLTVEEQPFGWCKHLSVSVDDTEKVPHPASIKILMQEFGMNKSLEECYVYIEEVSPKAVNIICPI